MLCLDSNPGPQTKLRSYGVHPICLTFSIGTWSCTLATDVQCNWEPHGGYILQNVYISTQSNATMYVVKVHLNNRHNYEYINQFVGNIIKPIDKNIWDKESFAIDGDRKIECTGYRITLYAVDSVLPNLATLAHF